MRRSHLISIRALSEFADALDQQQGPVAAEKQRCTACLCTLAATWLFAFIRWGPYDVSGSTIECAFRSVNEMPMQSFARNRPFVLPRSGDEKRSDRGTRPPNLPSRP
jgi:hypothetical protein